VLLLKFSNELFKCKCHLLLLLCFSKKPTRQRLIQAVPLFAAQGMTETTTREIAELEVNVTLFRHFGNKHNLFLAVIAGVYTVVKP